MTHFPSPQADASVLQNSGNALGSEPPLVDLAALADALRGRRHQWRLSQDHDSAYGAHGFPSRLALGQILDNLASALFPMRLGPRGLTLDTEDAFVIASLRRALPDLAAQIRMELHAGRAQNEAEIHERANAIVATLAHDLPEVRRLLDTDLEAAFAGDPAARTVDEVLLCYPSLTAMLHYRIAHVLYRQGAPLVARIITEIAHSRTGIDIHPGATIDESFFIDHGTGVVIGQTAIIGKRVRLYQAVTLGARSFASDDNGHLINTPRHPVIEDDVVIYAGATILGRITIGAGSAIGGNVWLTKSVAPRSVVRQGTPSISIETDPLANWP